jgi:aspartyl protease family protein
MAELPRWLKHATVWLVLATGLFLAVQAGLRQADQARVVVSGSGIELQRAADGHYHWPGRVAGRNVEFLVDTGATSTAIPAALAQQLRLEVVGRVMSSTAGGPVQADVVVGDVVLEGGVRAERLRMAAMPELSAPLLGRDVLGRLQLQQHGGVLRVDLATPRAQTP